MKSAAISFFLLLQVCAFAQNPAASDLIDIALVHDSAMVSSNCLLYIDSSGKGGLDHVPADGWKPMADYNVKRSIPMKWVTSTMYLKFTLTNSSDSTNRIFFIPGTYVGRSKFYKIESGGQGISLKDESSGDGFQPFEVKSKQQQTYVAAFYFSRRTNNLLIPQVIAAKYLPRYQKFHYYSNDKQLPVGLLLSGILLMMIFFTGANYMFSRKKEFLYNCCYSICMFLLIFLTALMERKSGIVSSLFREYFDFMFLAIGNVFYIAFTRKFLDTRTYYPRLNRFFINAEKFLLLLLSMFTYVVFFTDNFRLQEILENSVKVIALMIGIVYIVSAFSQKNKLMNYLAIGNIILIFFSVISFLLILFPIHAKGFFFSSMIFYEIGIVSELVSFLLGLTYKNRVELIEKTMEQESLKLEAEKQYFETKLAVLNAQQEERNRISADMHDDLGAGVTAIRLYSELAKRKIEKGSIPEIDKISSSANELLNNMNAIIWTMSSNNDTLDNMVAYIRSYALEYFENTGIDCHTHVDENLPKIAVTGDLRRNIYLVVKEALNNILKHAQATEVFLSLKRVPDGLLLYIQDNGKGIDLDNIRRFGNGLNNMRKRMAERSISFKIENHNGTLITLHYRLNFNSL